METKVIVSVGTDGPGSCSIYCDFYEKGEWAPDAPAFCSLFSSDLYRGERCDDCVSAGIELDSLKRELELANRHIAGKEAPDGS